ncbi:hypothetical protein D7X74_41150 [Corallococcus sp. CA047B]|uniref:helix-turn-helix domain-containing protein n=1 Tax=Corallococcus sp. CA047B TaxID=2316729 RepID=UPI000EA3DAA8|nr:helix-turn-helix domain-containing protein [Corallococcus sp. CA047B]RKG97013.1 hypothetical protein D7X74_41150 [Corallococcus sp. CA047B]
MSCRKRPEERIRFYRRGTTTLDEFRELRRRALARVARGETVSEVARDMSITADTISQWLSRARKAAAGVVIPSRRVAFHGPCAEPWCERRCSSKYGYCWKHTSVYVYRPRRAGLLPQAEEVRP